jgi:large repetitive protein
LSIRSKFSTQSVNIAVNFTNPNPCTIPRSGNNTAGWFSQYDVFSSIKVNAQATITAEDCGIIFTPTTVSILVPPLTNDNTPIVTGTCVSGDNLTIYLSPTNESFNGVICSDGLYSVTPTRNIPDGNYCGNIVAVKPSTDPSAGFQTATAQSCGVIDTATYITITVPAVSVITRPLITGTCEAGGTVNIVITNGINSSNIVNIIQPFQCAANGQFTLTPSFDIPNGPYCADGRIVDSAGNAANSISSCGIVDTGTFVTLSVPELTNSHFPFITGTCEVGATLEIKTFANPSLTPIQTINTTCPANGALASPTVGIYSATPTVSIPNSTYCR